MKLPFSFVLLATLACTAIGAHDARAGISRIDEDNIDPWMVYGGSDNGVRSCTVVAKVAQGAGFAVVASDSNRIEVLLINTAYRTAALDHANVGVDMQFDAGPARHYTSTIATGTGTISHTVDAADVPALVHSLSDSGLLTVTISAPISQTWKVDLTKVYYAMKDMKRDCIAPQHLDNLPAPFTRNDTYLNEPEHPKVKVAAAAAVATAPSQPALPAALPAGVPGLGADVPRTDARTMYEIGASYENKTDVLPDYAAARAWYTKAAAAGDVSAMLRLGWFYRSGIGGTVKDDNLATRYFTQAANTGNAAALLELAKFYDTGNLFSAVGVERKAVVEALYVRAANTGSTQAMMAAGDWYASNPAFIGNAPAKSLQMYLRASDAGNVIGMQKAGWDYIMHIGMPKEEINPAKGIELLEKAADGNNYEAMQDLSFIYAGDNVPEGTAPIDKAKAKYWWDLFLRTRASQNAR